MRILCLDDLHHNFYEMPGDPQIAALDEAVSCNAPLDAIVLAGDIYEHDLRKSPYAMLDRLFKDLVDCPVICVLGNHEFLYKHVDRELNRMTTLYRPDKYNVHYLDVVGGYKVGKYSFVGNVLWYDGSLRSYPNQRMQDWGRSPGSDLCWADRHIKNFRFEEEHGRCLRQIRDNLAPSHNILVTHCVPFRQLNTHPEGGVFNAYSGVDNIVGSLGCDCDIRAAICGHTHRRVIGEFNGTPCVNPGNDYGWPPLERYVLELEDRHGC